MWLTRDILADGVSTVTSPLEAVELTTTLTAGWVSTGTELLGQYETVISLAGWVSTVTFPLEVMVLETTDAEVSVLKTPVLSDPCVTTPVLDIPVLKIPVPAVPTRTTPVLKTEPETKMDGLAKPFTVEFV